MQTDASQTPATLAKTKVFWGSGAALVSVLVVALTAEFVIWTGDISQAEQIAKSAVRQAHPQLQWALDEWDRCNHGYGDYAKYGYLHKEQCDMALRELGKVHGQQTEVMTAITEQGERMDAGARNVVVLWPLSMIILRAERQKP